MRRNPGWCYHQSIDINTTMKSNLWKVALIAGCLGAGVLATPAAPLERGTIPADPSWLVHLDCDALRSTMIGQYVLTEMDKPEAKAKLAVFQSLFSFDLRTQLHGLTLYGTNASPEDGVLIVYADFEADQLTNLAKAAKDYQSSQHKDIVIHSWIDEKKKSDITAKPRTYAALQGNRIIFGQRENQVMQALEVISSTTPSLKTSNRFPALGSIREPHFFEAVARKMKLPDTDPNAAILNLSQTVQLVIGETQNRFQGTLTLVADSDEIAAHVLSIVQGLVGLVKLQNDKPESQKIAKALTFRKDGNQVTGNLTLPAGEAVAIIKTDAVRKAAAKATAEANK